MVEGLASYAGQRPKEEGDTLALRLGATIETLAKCESELCGLRTKISGSIDEISSNKEQPSPLGIYSQTLELQARSQRILDIINSISRAVA